MRRSLLALPLAALVLAPLAAHGQEAPPRVITVTGEGRSDRKPDTAVVSLGVSEQAATAGEAMAAMATGMEAVLATLTEAGLSPADIQTGQLTLEAAYDYDSGSSVPPVTGYVATQVVDVRVREIGAVGGVLDAVTEGGANRINGIAFGLDDPAGALEEARGAAVADARLRAEFYAEAAGVTLGDLLQITEGAAFGGPQPLARFDAAAESVPVAPGQVTTTALVTVTYAIE